MHYQLRSGERYFPAPNISRFQRSRTLPITRLPLPPIALGSRAVLGRLTLGCGDATNGGITPMLPNGGIARLLPNGGRGGP